jgi:hypothetical protein
MGSRSAVLMRAPTRNATRRSAASLLTRTRTPAIARAAANPTHTAAPGRAATIPAVSAGERNHDAGTLHIALQRKLMVGAVNDPLEHEADRVAEQVMRMPAPAHVSQASPLRISRKCAACEEEEKEKPRTKPGRNATSVAEAPPIVHHVLASPGQPLDPATRAFFEPRFGHDFGGVRIHADTTAAAAASSIRARAFAANRSIAFGTGEYAPQTKNGRRLLGHELAHLVQQSTGVPGASRTIQRQDVGSDPYKPLAVAPASTYVFTLPPSALPAVGGPPFKNAAIQSVYANAAKLSAIQVQALQALDVNRSGPWKNLVWADVAASAADRVVNPANIDQKVLGVCASAAALEAEAATNAKGYADEVCHVFSKAEIGGTKLNRDLLNGKPPKGMDPCDWMMLSASQDASNLVRDYKGTPGEAAGGAYQRGQEWLVKHISDCVRVTTISCEYWGEDDATKKVSGLMAKYGDKVVVIVSCDGDMLESATPGHKADGTGKKSGGHNHVVRLLSIKFGDVVQFTIFTWGSVLTLTWDVKRFRTWVYRYTVGAKQADVQLDD